MPTLTVTVDEDLLRRAERFAAARNTTVTEMVERFLRVASEPLRPEGLSPIARSIAGILPPMTDEEVDRALDEYRMRKYGGQ